jgi:hypothetical protein
VAHDIDGHLDYFKYTVNYKTLVDDGQPRAAPSGAARRRSSTPSTDLGEKMASIFLVQLTNSLSDIITHLGTFLGGTL